MTAVKALMPSALVAIGLALVTALEAVAPFSWFVGAGLYYWLKDQPVLAHGFPPKQPACNVPPAPVAGPAEEGENLMEAIYLRRTKLAFVVAVGLALAALGPRTGSLAAAELDVATVNKMDQAAFTEALGGIFEKSPWVAEAAWASRPFASVDDLHAKMVAVVRYANIDGQLKLLRSHPDLAGKEAQASEMTASSVAEQASAGLNALSKEEVATLAKYNEEYKQRFGFPFMIAVRNHTKLGIFNLFQQRLHNDTVTELGTALQQVYNITRIRLEKKFEA